MKIFNKGARTYIASKSLPPRTLVELPDSEALHLLRLYPYDLEEVKDYKDSISKKDKKSIK